MRHNEQVNPDDHRDPSDYQLRKERAQTLLVSEVQGGRGSSDGSTEVSSSSSDDSSTTDIEDTTAVDKDDNQIFASRTQATFRAQLQSKRFDDALSSFQLLITVTGTKNRYELVDLSSDFLEAVASLKVNQQTMYLYKLLNKIHRFLDYKYFSKVFFSHIYSALLRCRLHPEYISRLLSSVPKAHHAIRLNVNLGWVKFCKDVVYAVKLVFEKNQSSPRQFNLKVKTLSAKSTWRVGVLSIIAHGKSMSHYKETVGLLLAKEYTLSSSDQRFRKAFFLQLCALAPYQRVRMICDYEREEHGRLTEPLAIYMLRRYCLRDAKVYARLPETLKNNLSFLHQWLHHRLLPLPRSRLITDERTATQALRKVRSEFLTLFSKVSPEIKLLITRQSVSTKELPALAQIAHSRRGCDKRGVSDEGVPGYRATYYENRFATYVTAPSASIMPNDSPALWLKQPSFVPVCRLGM